MNYTGYGELCYQRMQGIVDDTKAEIILNMFKKGYTLEQIADVTEKSISEIEKIVKKEPARA